MSFDEEVDAARQKLKSARANPAEPAFDELAALQALAPKVEEKIQSRRLLFVVGDDEDADADADDEALSIAVIHAETDEVLGHIYAEDGEFIFESEMPEYFEDFVDEDSDAFVARLYEALKNNLARYELDGEAD